MVEWLVPVDISDFPRIFAVIDPDNSISEIHENNNKGFNMLTVWGVVPIDNKTDKVKIETLINKQLSAGEHVIEFNSDRLSSGIYFYHLQTSEFTSDKKMIYLK